MTKDEALRLALEALENLGNHDHVCPQWPTYAEPENYPKCNCGYDQAITAIKAALEAKDEPDKYAMDIECTKCGAKQSGVLTVHTTPPQRKPLTDEEVIDIGTQCQWYDGDCERFDSIGFARAIEAAHGIKEEA